MAHSSDFDLEGLNGKAICVDPDLRLLAGSRLDRSCNEVAAVANALGRAMTARHNGRLICADPGESGADVLARVREVYEIEETE